MEKYHASSSQVSHIMYAECVICALFLPDSSLITWKRTFNSKDNPKHSELNNCLDGIITDPK